MPISHPRGGRDWRSALAAFDPGLARAPVTLHAAQMLLIRGLNAEAESAMRDFVDRFPEHLQGLQTFGMLLRRMGRPDESAEVLARAAAMEAGRFGVAPGECGAVAQFMAAANQSALAPSEAPAAYVTALFDESADKFEDLLRGNLAYRAPELLLEAFTRVAGPVARDLDILDLGCGTGLAGELFRPLARRLDGVDLSPKMLALATAKGVYDCLDVGEVVAHLAHLGEIEQGYDLIVAADVFVYLGDLVPVFAAARRALRPGGWLAFTVETIDGDDYCLQPVRRYAHSRNYLTRSAEATGFDVRCQEETSVRDESYRPVRSLVCVWGKAGETEATSPTAPGQGA